MVLQTLPVLPQPWWHCPDPSPAWTTGDQHAGVDRLRGGLSSVLGVESETEGGVPLICGVNVVGMWWECGGKLCVTIVTKILYY